MGKAYDIRKVIRDVDNVNAQREVLKEKSKLLDERMAQIRKECPHIWEFIPDASGGHDSENWCDLCGLHE